MIDIFLMLILQLWTLALKEYHFLVDRSKSDVLLDIHHNNKIIMK
jgi:hypothetical protein